MGSAKKIARGAIWTTMANIVNGIYGFISVPLLIAVNVLFPALTPAHKNITFAASTLKQKSYAERKSQLSGSLRSVSAVQ